MSLDDIFAEITVGDTRKCIDAVSALREKGTREDPIEADEIVACVLDTLRDSIKERGVLSRLEFRSAADECYIPAGNSGRCMRERHKEQHDREDIRFWWKRQGVDIDAPCTVRNDTGACDRA